MLQQALQTNVEIDLKIYVNGEVRTFRHDCTSFHFLDNQRAAPFRSHKRRNCRFLSSPKLFLNIMMIFWLKLSVIRRSIYLCNTDLRISIWSNPTNEYFYHLTSCGFESSSVLFLTLRLLGKPLLMENHVTVFMSNFANLFAFLNF